MCLNECPRQPHPHVRDNAESEPPFYWANLPSTISLELANHPILYAVRDMLFPNLGVVGQQIGGPGTCLVTVLTRYDGGAFIVVLPRAAPGARLEERAHGVGSHTCHTAHQRLRQYYGSVERLSNYPVETPQELRPLRSGRRIPPTDSFVRRLSR
jgi:hypothetical protein